MSATFRGFFLIVCTFLISGFIGCQRGPDAPAGPSRELAGAGACKSAGFSDASAIYTDNRTRNDKLGQCKDILSFDSKGNAAAAERGIDVLLAALSQDLHACPGAGCVLAAVGSETLEQSVADFAGEACGLVPALSDHECLVPSASDVADGNWLAAGGVGEGATLILPNGEFGIQVDDLKSDLEADGIFVMIRGNAPTDSLGPCPQDAVHERDCEQKNVDVDSDPEGAFEEDGLYVETCEEESFVALLARCSGGFCEEGEPETRHILSCSIGSKFSATSTFVGSDDDLRVRDVLCSVTSTSASVSEGTVCRLFELSAGVVGDQVGQCTTTATGSNTSECGIPGLAQVPVDNTCFRMTAQKILGSGSHSGQKDFCMDTDSPARGVTEVVDVNVLPSGQQ